MGSVRTMQRVYSADVETSTLTVRRTHRFRTSPVACVVTTTAARVLPGEPSVQSPSASCRYSADCSGPHDRHTVRPPHDCRSDNRRSRWVNNSHARVLQRLCDYSSARPTEECRLRDLSVNRVHATVNTREGRARLERLDPEGPCAECERRYPRRRAAATDYLPPESTFGVSQPVTDRGNDFERRGCEVQPHDYEDATDCDAELGERREE